MNEAKEAFDKSKTVVSVRGNIRCRAVRCQQWMKWANGAWKHRLVIVGWYELWLGSQWRRFVVRLMSDFITTTRACIHFTQTRCRSTVKGRNSRALNNCRSHTHLLLSFLLCADGWCLLIEILRHFCPGSDETFSYSTKGNK